MRTKTIKRALIGAGALSLLAATPVFAAPPSGPTGMIELMNSPSSAESTEPLNASSELSGPTFGGVAEFHTEVYGKVSAKARVYVSVACEQGDNVVYQYSKSSSTDDYSFPLLDQAGQGLNWENGGDADCEAWLIYRVEKGKRSEITVLGEPETFKVTDPGTTVFV
jgi:hypothetical protein